jgi:hypothetical protein
MRVDLFKRGRFPCRRVETNWKTLGTLFWPKVFCYQLITASKSSPFDSRPSVCFEDF